MTDDVEAYYNDNTRRFLAFGKGGSTGAIHRAVWAPGVTSQTEAMRYVDDYVAEVFSDRAIDTGTEHTGPLLDLGCGVGATMAHIGERVPPAVVGVTISPVQAAMIRERLPSTTVHVGDFEERSVVLEAAGGSGVASGAYMIESLCHAGDAERVLENVAAALAPGAHLVVCDDMAARRDLHKTDLAWVETYRRGWHVGTFQTSAELIGRADAAGFDLVEIVDLTGYIANGRPRDVAIRIVMALCGRLPIRSAWWDNMVGGNALQRLYRRGAARYMLHTFTRRR